MSAQFDLIDRLTTIIARDHYPECSALRGEQCDCGHTETPAEALEDIRLRERINAMTDEQVEAELREAGMDVEKETKRSLVMIRVALERNAAIKERDSLLLAKAVADAWLAMEDAEEELSGCESTIDSLRWKRLNHNATAANDRLDEAVQAYRAAVRP